MAIGVVVIIYAVMVGMLVATWMYRRFLKQPAPIDPHYRPRTAILMGVRGFDPEFEAHLHSVLHLDYANYEIVFAVAERCDEAYPLLQAICRAHPQRARLVVAGLPWTCSEKIHNVLAAYNAISSDVEVIVVVDADIELHPLFLQRMVAPLQNPAVGATTGYRWLVPTTPTLPRLVAAMTNAAGAVSVWLTRNLWGGSMALRRDTFEQLDVAARWQVACSEDQTLGAVLKQATLRVVAISDALAVSHQAYSWRTYWEFLVRQLIVVRVYNPALWWQILFGYVITIGAMLYSVSGSVAWALGAIESPLPLLLLPLLALYMLQGWLVIDGAQRAIMRRGDRVYLIRWWHMPIYLLAVVVGMLQVFASATRRFIIWRGVRYTLYSAHRTGVERPLEAMTYERATGVGHRASDD